MTHPTRTAATAATRTTLGSWLLPGTRDTRLRLEKVVAEAADHEETGARRLRILGTVARNALIEEVEAALRALLSETVADLVVGGWRLHGTIRAAVGKSRDEPGVDQVVPLRNHTVRAEHEHQLDVVVDGVRVMTLGARVDAALQLFDAVAVVRDGRLAAVRSGRGQATAELTVEDAQVARERWTFPLTAELRLHHPLSLSDSAPAPASEVADGLVG